MDKHIKKYSKCLFNIKFIINICYRLIISRDSFYSLLYQNTWQHVAFLFRFLNEMVSKRETIWILSTCNLPQQTYCHKINEKIMNQKRHQIKVSWYVHILKPITYKENVSAQSKNLLTPCWKLEDYFLFFCLYWLLVWH